MGSVALRPNGRWRARYRDSTGREHARHFLQENDAQHWLDAVATPSTVGHRIHELEGDVTFREYAEVWRSIRLHRASSSAHVETMLRRHVYPTLGGRTLGTIVHSDIQTWVSTLSTTAGLATSTVRVIHGIVSSVFLAAVRDRRLTTNPCEGTRLPVRERRLVVPLRTEQVARLRAEGIAARSGDRLGHAA